MTEAKKQDECFVVCAIGSPGTETRLHADWVLEEIIEPVFAAHFPDMKVVRGDRMNKPGLIDAQVIDKLLNAKLVIADLTFLNPNAFYELGIRHVVAKPAIHIHREGEDIPFDVSLYRSMPFQRSEPAQMRAARLGLKELIEAALDPANAVENPVTKARGVVAFDQTASPAQAILQDQIVALSEQYDGLRQQIDMLTRATIPGAASLHHDLKAASSIFDGGMRLGATKERLPVELMLRNVHSNPKRLHDFVSIYLSPALGEVTIIENNGNNLLLEVSTDNLTDEIWASLRDRAVQRGLLMRWAR